MPKSSNRKFYGLTSEFIEYIHDTGIALMWPDSEPVPSRNCLEPNLLESASLQPFQSGYGIEYYPTLTDKAACLFFSIVGGHIFGNGNKRTGVLALDIFMAANSVYLAIPNDQMVKLAELTASYNERGEDRQIAIDRIRDAIRNNSVEFRQIRMNSLKVYRSIQRSKRVLQKNAAFLFDASNLK